MNHYQDIEDGLDEYLEADQRRKDEAFYRICPRNFDWLAKKGGFTVERVLEVSFTGPKIEVRSQPSFSYWSGRALLIGIYEGQHQTLSIAWDQGGDILQVSGTHSWP